MIKMRGGGGIRARAVISERRPFFTKSFMFGSILLQTLAARAHVALQLIRLYRISYLVLPTVPVMSELVHFARRRGGGGEGGGGADCVPV